MPSFRLITPPPYSFVELIPPLTLTAVLSLLISCAPSAQAERDPTSPSSQPYTSSHSKRTKPVEKAQRRLEGEWGEGVFNQGLDPMKLHRPERNEGVAIFAGGCFWCMEAPFEKLEGVVAVYSGYTGGESASPTYGQVSASRTQHLEAVIVYYRPKSITYETLLHHYWRSINPTQADGQFADRGLQYTTAIFTVTDAQREAAERSKRTLDESRKFNQPIAVKVRSAHPFWPAESYHQDYYKTNEGHYLRYKYGSGRAAYLKQTWGVE